MSREIEKTNSVLQKVSKGDHAAFKALFNLYRNKVYGYSLSIMHASAPAEEIVQEVFIKIWLKREALLEIENFDGFLRQMSKNETLNYLKKTLKDVERIRKVFEQYTDLDYSTENGIDYKETKQLLDDAIDKLPAQQKLIYNLCTVQGRKQEDVANELKLSPHTVKTHLRDAMKSIRDHLQVRNGLRLTTAFLLLFKFI